MPGNQWEFYPAIIQIQCHHDQTNRSSVERDEGG